MPTPFLHVVKTSTNDRHTMIRQFSFLMHSFNKYLCNVMYGYVFVLENWELKNSLFSFAVGTSC